MSLVVIGMIILAALILIPKSYFVGGLRCFK